MTRKYYRWFVAGVILSVMLLGVGTPGFVRAAVLPAPPAPVKIFLPFVEGGLSVGAPKPTATPTVQSTPTSIVQPTATPTLQPTATPIPRPTSTPRPQPSPTPSSGGVTVLAAGDIAMCGRPGDQQTAKIISGISGTVLALGDNAYDSGLSTEYSTCYDPTWGAFKNRTYPVPGNHDYMTL